jgi:Ran GTPase-activating protein (RanGAP) involved in mRNA processing and transport
VGSHLHKLKLIANNIGLDSVTKLQKVISKARYLTCIDLSYSKLTYASSVLILEAISKNVKLHDVNLSYAPLVENQNFG